MLRTDSIVDFNWGTQGPHPSISADNFTVKWSGQVEAPATGSYTFNIQADDGLRLWLDGNLVINAPNAYYPSWFVSSPITLEAGHKYDIRVEYTEVTGNAAVELCWRYPGQERQVIPQNRLYSTPISNNPMIPASPVNLTAIGAWRDKCCGGQAMAHVSLSWSRPTTSPVPTATFNIYRDGGLIKSGVTDTTWEDMSVSSGQTYTYQVSGVTGSGTEGTKSASASATAPFAPIFSTGWTAPTNLCIQGIWSASGNRPTDILAWDKVSGAVRYNIYQYDQLIGSTSTETTFIVPVASYYNSMTYAVTAVDSQGVETLPSNIVSAQGANDPNISPRAVTKPPKVPSTPKAVTEWNMGSPRVRLKWLGATDAYTYNIYRDGVKVATGIWGQTWFDINVHAGEQHSYSVSSVNLPWRTPVESSLSPVVKALVSPQPIINPGARVVVTQIVPNDDSVKVYFNAVPGAVDYRIYDANKPGSYKYSGGSLSIEMNGLTPGVTTMLVAEAVDKLGPFQKMDGMLGPGGMNHEGHVNMATNGLGDPSNVPVVLAASTPFSVTCQPRILSGSQVFFDTFRNSQPFVSAPVPAPLLAKNTNEVTAVANDKWTIYNVRGDQDTSRVFVMGNHFMDTFYDAGTPGSGGPLHNTKSSLVMQPKPTADINGDKVLHVTFEVDAHFSGRRWCNLVVAGADDTLLNPGSFWSANELPTLSGQIFQWEITASSHLAEIFRGKDGAGNLVAVKLLDPANGSSFSSRHDTLWSDMPEFNGSLQDLDKRHRFDLYISRTRFRLMEEGRTIKDSMFPNGVTLPFNKATVYFVHQVYHSAAERSEYQMYNVDAPYWINSRPYADERHWDNMGFEVLNSFPSTTP